MEELFEHGGMEQDSYEMLNEGHGCLELRECWSIWDRECLDYLDPKEEWKGLSSVAKVTG